MRLAMAALVRASARENESPPPILLLLLLPLPVPVPLLALVVMSIYLGPRLGIVNEPNAAPPTPTEEGDGEYAGSDGVKNDNLFVTAVTAASGDVDGALATSLTT